MDFIIQVLIWVGITFFIVILTATKTNKNGRK